MPVSKTLVSTAAAAAIFSVAGLFYAQITERVTTPPSDDTEQVQQQTRNDTVQSGVTSGDAQTL